MEWKTRVKSAIERVRKNPTKLERPLRSSLEERTNKLNHSILALDVTGIVIAASGVTHCGILLFRGDTALIHDTSAVYLIPSVYLGIVSLIARAMR